MKIFVTGATGFIGSHLVERLSQTSHEVRCLVRESSETSQLESQGIGFVRGDVTDRDSVLAGMEGCHWVANLANVYSFWERRPAIYREVNVDGTVNVMEAAIECGVAKVVHVSSVVTYGKPQQQPFTEETLASSELFSEYARTKFEGDELVWRIREERQLPVIMVYPAAVLGPGDTKASGQYVIDLLNRALPTSVFHESIMTWVHVRDCAEVIVAALEKEGNEGERYIVAGERLTVRAFNEMVSELSGVPGPRIKIPDPFVVPNAALLTAMSRLTGKRPPWGMALDQQRTLRAGIEADGGKAERELAITYTPIRTALAEVIEWYRQSGCAQPG